MAREHLFDREMLSIVRDIELSARVAPLVIGATSGSGGGSGTPPGGIVGQLAQIYVAGDTTENVLYGVDDPASLLDNLARIRAWESPSVNFWANTSNTDYLTISSGSWYYEDGKPSMIFAGGNTPSLSSPSGGSRYDLLTINSSGTLAWSSTAEGNPPIYPTTRPRAVSGQLPLWTVLSRSSGSSIERYDDGINHYIFRDERPFLGAPTFFPSSGSAYTDYRWFVDGMLSPSTDINGVYYIPDDFTLKGSYGYLKVTPSSGSTIVDLQYSTTNGASWTSIYSSTKLTILSGDNFGSQAPDAITLPVGTLVKANLDDAGGGSAASLSINLYGTIASASGGGTVANVSVLSHNGIISTVTNGTTTPSIDLSLGNILTDGTIEGSNLTGINTGDQKITLTGDVAGTGTGAIPTTLSNTGITPGAYTLASVTFSADGRALLASSGSGTAAIYPYPPFDVGGTASSGSSLDASAGDHVHVGVPSITPDDGTPISGAITLRSGANITLTPVGNEITFSASSGSGGVTFATIAESNAGILMNVAVNPAGLPLRVENGALINNQAYEGNIRGNYAVDLQSARTYPDAVASGDCSSIAGGVDNAIIAKATAATINGGFQNTIYYQPFSVICGGISNVIDTADQLCGVISGGEGNRVEVSYGSIPGGTRARSTNYGQHVHSSGWFDTEGDAQGTIQMVARRQIDHSSATGWQDLYLDGASIPITIPDNSVWTMDILVNGTTAGLSDRGNYRIVAAVANIAGTVQIDAQTTTDIFETQPLWNVQMGTSGNTIIIQVTDGSGSQTIRWDAIIRTSELSYPVP